MKRLKYIGLSLFSVGILLVIGYGLFDFFKEIWMDPDFPLLIRIGLPLIILGLLVLISALMIERLTDSKKEKTYDNDHNL